MKLTNRELLNFMNSQLGNKHLPVKVTFAIAANAAEADIKQKAYEESKKKLIEKHAKKDKDGNPVIEDKQYVFKDPVKWEKEIVELFDAEVEMNVTTVKLKDLAKCDEAEFDSLTVNELSAIRFMIEK